MRVAVSGWRHATKEGSVLTVTQAMYQVRLEADGPVTLLHGGADGIDSIAVWVANIMGWTIHPAFKAEWNKYGKAAGPIRNHKMLDTMPDLLLAFPGPGSRGTIDAIEYAERLGITTRVRKVFATSEKDSLNP